MRCAAWLVVAAACSGAGAPPPSNRAVVSERLLAIDDVPRLALDRQPVPAGATRDCRLGAVLRTRFHGQIVRACGVLAGSLSHDMRGAELACFGRALANGEPFLVEQQRIEVDGAAIVALVGMREQGRVAVYKLYYFTSTLPAESGTHVERCRGEARRIDCTTADLADCVSCAEWEEIDDCRFVPHKLHPPG